jgi:sigma-B regulation protein RsbU (phosphoserine phosphatase)
MSDQDAAADALRRLLASFVALARSQGDEQLLKASLADAVAVAAELTQAEQGSLLLLDPAGRVIESLLARGATSQRETDRLVGQALETGLAGWVRSHRAVGLVADTTTDSRWVSLPGDPHRARSALAVPVRRGAELAGILTLTHAVPGHFTAEAAALMELTAGQMALVLDNAALYQRLAELNRGLQAELQAGRHMQRGFLPRVLPAVDGWELAVRFQPARQVSGDFYDALRLPGGSLMLVLADVCGKGVGAALFMALIRSMLRVFAEAGAWRDAGVDPTRLPGVGQGGDRRAAFEALVRTHDYIVEHHRDLAMFATVFLGVLDVPSGRLAYINAGHDPLLVRNPRGDLTSLPPTGPAVGVRPQAAFEVRELALEPGDLLLGYTDGVIDARSPGGTAFGEERVRGILAQSERAADVIERIEAELGEHTGGAEPFDDVTALALGRR